MTSKYLQELLSQLWSPQQSQDLLIDMKMRSLLLTIALLFSTPAWAVRTDWQVEANREIVGDASWFDYLRGTIFLIAVVGVICKVIYEEIKKNNPPPAAINWREFCSLKFLKYCEFSRHEDIKSVSLT